MGNKMEACPGPGKCNDQGCPNHYAASPEPADDGPVASIDDMWVASGKEYDQSIHSNPDHFAWAELFVSTFPNLRADVDTMAGWFANAMMAKVDSMRAHTASPEPVAPDDAHQVIADLRAEVEALKADAERLYWLDNNGVFIAINGGGSIEWKVTKKITLRQAIDAARQREGG